MKKIIYAISLIFLLAACTDETYTGTQPSRGGEPGDPVPVKLTLNIQPMQSPLSLDTKGGSRVVSSTEVCKGMEVSLVETPATRAVFEDEIKNFWVLQFEGTAPDSPLCRIKFYESNSVKTVVLSDLQGAKSRIIVIANASKNTFNWSVNQITLGDFYQVGIPDTETGFPLFNDPSAGENRIIYAGSTDIVATANKQADIMLYRTIARVKVNLSLSDEMQSKGYTAWMYQFIHVPKKSFYYSTDRVAVFPEASVGYFDYPQQPFTPPSIIIDNVYLPVNLQNSVPFTTLAMRRINAPADATYLQVMGLQIAGSVISRSVIYQIHLGGNFTDNYSISPNRSYTYDITITGESEDDSRVVKFIPGYFGGPLKMYKSNGDEASTPGEADVWRYEKRIEVYINDVNPPGGIKWSETGGMPSILQQVNDLMDGRTNTWEISQAVVGTPDSYQAIRNCIALNGTPPASMEEMVWYMPSYGQSLGIYVAGSSMLKTLPNTIYWSSTANNSSAWGTQIWSGQSGQISPTTSYNLRCVKDLDQTSAMP